VPKKIKVRDKTVLRIADLYVVDGHDWRWYYDQLGEVLEQLRSGK
jgi:hypothetical protein